MNVPVSTHIVESAVIGAPVSKVWSVVSSMDFRWWQLISASELVLGASPSTLDATLRLTFKDGHNWTVQVRELSSIHKSVTFEVISCEPAASVSSAIHSISLKSVTSGETPATFVEWTTDFSSDATTETVIDSSFKRRDAFTDLAAATARLH